MINKIFGPILKHLPENNRLERIWKLAQVDFKKRYYNDSLGLFWALLNPLFRIGVYYVVFKHVFNHSTENYALFLFAGLIVWLTWVEAGGKGLMIIKSKKYLIENIKFNHLDLYVSSTISIFIGFLFNLSAFIVFLLIAGIQLSFNLFYIPILMLNVFIICIGTSMILAVIKIYFKDISHLWSIITLAGFWTSGVFMRGELFISAFPPIKFLHPFIGIIINMRNISMYATGLDWSLILINYIVGIIILITGIKLQNRFANKAIEML